MIPIPVFQYIIEADAYKILLGSITSSNSSKQLSHPATLSRSIHTGTKGHRTAARIHTAERTFPTPHSVYSSIASAHLLAASRMDFYVKNQIQKHFFSPLCSSTQNTAPYILFTHELMLRPTIRDWIDRISKSEVHVSALCHCSEMVTLTWRILWTERFVTYCLIYTF